MGTLSDMIAAAATKAGVDPAVLGSLVNVESSGNPNATGAAGEIGYTQLLPKTAAGLGINPYDPAQNLQGGANYLASLLKQYGGDYPKALAAYNAGSPTSSAGIAYANKVLSGAGIKLAQPGAASSTPPSQSATNAGQTVAGWSLYAIAIVVIIGLVLFGLWGIVKGS